MQIIGKSVELINSTKWIISNLLVSKNKSLAIYNSSNFGLKWRTSFSMEIQILRKRRERKNNTYSFANRNKHLFRVLTLYFCVKSYFCICYRLYLHFWIYYLSEWISEQGWKSMESSVACMCWMMGIKFPRKIVYMPTFENLS